MKIFVAFALLCVASAAFAAPNDIELPQALVVCARDSSNRDECLKESAQKFLQSFPSGIESLNIPSVDPFVVKNEHFEYNQNAIKGFLNIKQAKTFGISQAKIDSVRSRATDDKLDLEIDVIFPSLFMEGNYKGEGRINEIQLSAKGYFNISFTDVTTTWKMSGNLAAINGDEYMKIESFDMGPKVGGMKIYATGLFPDPQINSVANELVNQYWPIMYEAMLPQTRKYWEPILVNAANKVFLTIPYRRLLPKISE